jgi:hypothetical protein
MTERNLLGHIVSKQGVKIDNERVEEIKAIDFHINKRCDIFLGKLIFSKDSFQNLLPLSKKLLTCSKWEIK